MITDELDLGSRASLMLTSKALYRMIPPIPPKAWLPEDWIEFNQNFELHVPYRRALLSLTCTKCIVLKPVEMFSDSQRRKTCPRRFCISCGIYQRKYIGSYRSFRVGGVPMFGCAGCRKALPMYKEAIYRCEMRWTENARWCRDCWVPIDGYLRVKHGCGYEFKKDRHFDDNWRPLLR